MTIYTQSGLKSIGFYEMRSGKCPDCDVLFDDEIKSIGDKRYCPECKKHKLGNLKQKGDIVKNESG